MAPNTTHPALSEFESFWIPLVTQASPDTLPALRGTCRNGFNAVMLGATPATLALPVQLPSSLYLTTLSHLLRSSQCQDPTTVMLLHNTPCIPYLPNLMARRTIPLLSGAAVTRLVLCGSQPWMVDTALLTDICSALPQLCELVLGHVTTRPLSRLTPPGTPVLDWPSLRTVRICTPRNAVRIDIMSEFLRDLLAALGFRAGGGVISLTISVDSLHADRGHKSIWDERADQAVLCDTIRPMLTGNHMRALRKLQLPDYPYPDKTHPDGFFFTAGAALVRHAPALEHLHVYNLTWLSKGPAGRDGLPPPWADQSVPWRILDVQELDLSYCDGLPLGLRPGQPPLILRVRKAIAWGCPNNSDGNAHERCSEGLRRICPIEPSRLRPVRLECGRAACGIRVVTTNPDAPILRVFTLTATPLSNLIIEGIDSAADIKGLVEPSDVGLNLVMDGVPLEASHLEGLSDLPHVTKIQVGPDDPAYNWSGWDAGVWASLPRHITELSLSGWHSLQLVTQLCVSLSRVPYRQLHPLNLMVEGLERWQWWQAADRAVQAAGILTPGFLAIMAPNTTHDALRLGTFWTCVAAHATPNTNLALLGTNLLARDGVMLGATSATLTVQLWPPRSQPPTTLGLLKRRNLEGPTTVVLHHNTTPGCDPLAAKHIARRTIPLLSGAAVTRLVLGGEQPWMVDTALLTDMCVAFPRLGGLELTNITTPPLLARRTAPTAGPALDWPALHTVTVNTRRVIDPGIMMQLLAGLGFRSGGGVFSLRLSMDSLKDDLSDEEEQMQMAAIRDILCPMLTGNQMHALRKLQLPDIACWDSPDLLLGMGAALVRHAPSLEHLKMDSLDRLTNQDGTAPWALESVPWRVLEVQELDLRFCAGLPLGARPGQPPLILRVLQAVLWGDEDEAGNDECCLQGLNHICTAQPGKRPVRLECGRKACAVIDMAGPAAANLLDVFALTASPLSNLILDEIDSAKDLEGLVELSAVGLNIVMDGVPLKADHLAGLSNLPHITKIQVGSDDPAYDWSEWDAAVLASLPPHITEFSLSGRPSLELVKKLCVGLSRVPYRQAHPLDLIVEGLERWQWWEAADMAVQAAGITTPGFLAVAVAPVDTADNTAHQVMACDMFWLKIAAHTDPATLPALLGTCRSGANGAMLGAKHATITLPVQLPPSQTRTTLDLVSNRQDPTPQPTTVIFHHNTTHACDPLAANHMVLRSLAVQR